MNLTSLWHKVLAECAAAELGLHGPAHWARVERNGLYIAERAGVNRDVVMLFALFHDCMRRSDGRDPEHGLRSAEYARSVRDLLDGLSGADLDRLCYACQWHTHQRHHDDPTIGACWDADRLDIERAGIVLSAEFLNTAPAIEIAQNRSFASLDALAVREVSAGGGPLRELDARAARR
ncbi:MAG: hypothetical protein FJZ90_05395 [Chloroflexi bacterium]|nr:hypothetical protein [Chloroflexota bacterium]